jgi:hypothetical protein
MARKLERDRPGGMRTWDRTRGDDQQVVEQPLAAAQLHRVLVGVHDESCSADLQIFRGLAVTVRGPRGSTLGDVFVLSETAART